MRYYDIMNFYGIIIVGIVIILNISLLQNLTAHFGGKRAWIAAALCSVEAACYLIPYFAAERIFYMQELMAGTLLFLLCFFLIHKTKKIENGAQEPDGKQTLLLLVIPIMGLAMLLCLFLGDLKPYFLPTLCCSFVLVANLSVFYLYHMITQNDTHVRRQETYRQQTAYYRNQLEVIEESGGRLRALRHDMKNHILHLRAELRQGNEEDALRYLEEMEAELQTPGEYAKTGNREIDSLLNYKLQKAAQILSSVTCHVNVPAELMPKSFDINVILGNLLDNAIEAAQDSGEKWLQFTMRADRGVLLLRVANSFSKMPQRKGKTFLSAKRENGEHGIGLQNVRRMVERQNGSLEIVYEDGAFAVEVMLYMNEV